MEVVNASDVKSKFNAETYIQKKLGRVMILSDAAHSLGATYHGKRTGIWADASVFSFHAVKNLTTAEGGAIALMLPPPFSNEEVYKFLCIYTLHGQNKDALAKMQKGNWKYDIIEAGFKCNMTDLVAAIGLIELRRYNDDTLVVRKQVCDYYYDALSAFDWAQLPILRDAHRESSYHLFPLRIKGVSEEQRDTIIQAIFDEDVSVNVHFIPLPQLSFYKKQGFNIDDYPVTYSNFATEISLPIFYDLTIEQKQRVVSAVVKAVESVLVKAT